jgi:hypothetical protein
MGFLQKLVPHRSLTLHFELFRFWLRIRGDIRNRKTTPRLSVLASRRLSESVSRGVGDSPTHRVRELLTLRLDYDYLRKFEAKIGTARNVVLGTYAEPVYAKTPENPPHCHVPLKWPDS